MIIPYKWNGNPKEYSALEVIYLLTSGFEDMIVEYTVINYNSWDKVFKCINTSLSNTA